MADLFPDKYSDDIISLSDIQKNNPVGYKTSPFFDDETGDLLMDGQGRIITASGIEAWKQWCANCVDTQRYALLYSTDFGVNYNLIFETYRKYGAAMAESVAQREITDALMADDYKRTKSVTDFDFDWSVPDGVIIYFKVVGIENAEINLYANIKLR